MSAPEPVATDRAADPTVVAERLVLVRERIERAGGDPEAIRIVAVTKTFGLDVVRAALHAGCTHFGENYADELVAKASALAAESDTAASRVAWYFIGGIQRNKIPRLVPHVAVYEGVSRVEEGEAIAKRAPGATVCVEVDTTGAPQRPGVAVRDVAPLVRALRALDLDVAGLMTVAPPGGGAAASAAFTTVRDLADELGLVVRSMGMSDDFDLAVAAGATEIRLGSVLFGPRATPR